MPFHLQITSNMQATVVCRMKKEKEREKGCWVLQFFKNIFLFENILKYFFLIFF